jgi:hypothetical protein
MMDMEESQARAQALLDSWTRTGAELGNSIPLRDMVATALAQAFTDGEAAMYRQLTLKKASEVP